MACACTVISVLKWFNKSRMSISDESIVVIDGSDESRVQTPNDKDIDNGDRTEVTHAAKVLFVNCE